MLKKQKLLVTSSEVLDQLSSINSKEFWQIWQQHQNYLYRCCLKWMGGNVTEAQEAMSQAMLKAWEKYKHYVGKITNDRAWLSKITHNVCVDIHRQNNRFFRKYESLETMDFEKQLDLCSEKATPDLVA